MRYSYYLPPGSGRMEKRRTTILAKQQYIMASLSCASMLCAVVLNYVVTVLTDKQIKITYKKEITRIV